MTGAESDEPVGFGKGQRPRRIALNSERTVHRAEPIAGHTQLGAMRLMTVAACHASGKHSALLERTVIIHFVAHLTVDFIKSTGQ